MKMKNMSNSLVTKVLAFFLITLTALTFVTAVTSSVYTGMYDIDRDPKMAFFKSRVCSDITTDYAMKAYEEYFKQANLENPDESAMEDFKNYFSKENTNFFFSITDENDTVILSNYTDQYGYKLQFSIKGGYTMTAYVRKDISASDDYLFPYNMYDLLNKSKNILIPIASVSLVITVMLFIYLIYSAARKKNQEQFQPNFIDKIPFDIYTLFIVGVFVLGYIIGMDILGGLYESYMYQQLVMFLCFSFAFVFLSLMIWIVSFAARIKLKTLFKNNLVYMVIRFICKCIKAIFMFIFKVFTNIPLLWKLLLSLAAISLVELILMVSIARGSYAPIAFWFLMRIGIVALLCFAGLNMIKIKKAGEAIAWGNLDYKIQSKYMLNDFKRHADNLNSISIGMSNAINERMKSEHFKSELITNVSHDIRTPLTSIINYVDLLDRQDIHDETSKEYISILKKQSARLKKLTEDLIEASKATSGVINVNMEKLNVNEILSQAVGEYAQRLSENHIEPVINPFDNELFINADGRLIWRVMDNILGNICKYSQADTRAYITVEQKGKSVHICFKNVSAYKLNISADELMERFVRGDAARTGDGSGLGLSIAKSLTELMKGRLSLDIEGDLFKACLVFEKS